MAFGGNNCSGPIDVATALNAHGGATGRLDFESETFVASVAPTLDASFARLHGQDNQHIDAGAGLFIAGPSHTLRGEGFDASEDGTGRGTPIVPVYAILERAVCENPNAGPDGMGVGTDIAYTLEARTQVQAIAFDTTQITSKANRSNPKAGDPCHPLAAQAHAPCIAFDPRQSDVLVYGDMTGPLDTMQPGPAIAFSCKDHGADAADELAPTLRAMGHGESHANAGGQAAVAFDLRGREGGAQFEGPHDTANIRAANGGSSRSYVAESWAVRQLTPVECARLQGFPDHHSRIAWRGKPAEACPDGPQYKTYGNSMAVPVMRWLAERLQANMPEARP